MDIVTFSSERSTTVAENNSIGNGDIITIVVTRLVRHRQNYKLEICVSSIF